MKKSHVEMPVEVTEKPVMNLSGKYVFADTKITFVENNPKRPSGKSHARFEAYKNAKSVQEAIAAGCTKADLRYDFDHKFVTLSE